MNERALTQPLAVFVSNWSAMSHAGFKPMDTRISIWNVLHDGEITAVSEEGDTLTMFVSIPYLRRRLKPLGDSFVITLSGVRCAECRDFGGAASSAMPLREALEIGAPERFSAASQSPCRWSSRQQWAC